MLFTFKSAASADLIMHEMSGKKILAVLGKHPDDTRGIITVEQLPGAISTLQTAIAVDKAKVPETIPSQRNNEGDDELAVSLAQRALPFIEMLESAVKAGEPIVWGV